MEKENYGKTEIYVLFLWNCLMIFEEAVRNLEKDELATQWIVQCYVKTATLLQWK